MGFSGKIEDLPVLDILQYLHAGNKSGTLKMTRENETAYVYFQKGNIIHAVSPQSSNIGDLMIENKDISLKTLQKALVFQSDRGKGKPVGQILVEMGAITQEQLKQVVLKQIEEVIYHLVSWIEGEFTFDPDEMTPVDDINLNPTTILPSSNVNTQHLLLETVRLLDEKNKGAQPGPRPIEAAGKAPLKVAAAAEPRSPVRPIGEFREVQVDKVEEQAARAFETRRVAGTSVPILLVTDDGIFKNLLRDELLEMGMEVVTPATIGECLTKCGQYLNNGVTPFILLEDRFPGTNRRRSSGMLFLMERERSRWFLPVLILLSDLNQETMIDLYKAGARAIFPKPNRDGLKEAQYSEAIKNIGEIVRTMMRQCQEEAAGQAGLALENAQLRTA